MTPAKVREEETIVLIKIIVLGVNNLTSLNLGSNRITSISKKMFKHLTGLLSLDLSNNQLEAIPAGCIHSLAHLEVLLLNGNRLNTIGKFMLSGLRELRWVFL